MTEWVVQRFAERGAQANYVKVRNGWLWSGTLGFASGEELRVHLEVLKWCVASCWDRTMRAIPAQPSQGYRAGYTIFGTYYSVVV